MNWLLDLISWFGGLTRPAPPKKPKSIKGSQMPQESDLSIKPIDDTPSPITEAVPYRKPEPRPFKEAPLYKYSRRSLNIFKGIHPKHGQMSPVYPPLADVGRLAINYSPIDITVLSATLRTEEEQRRFVREGRSFTMDSLHLPQDDGFVHAIDLGALEGGALSWRPDAYFDIAEAMQKAARELDIDVVWGGCWRNINTEESIASLHADYIQEVASRPLKNGRQQRPFFDGPHFQIR